MNRAASKGTMLDESAGEGLTASPFGDKLFVDMLWFLSNPHPGRWGFAVCGEGLPYAGERFFQHAPDEFALRHFFFLRRTTKALCQRTLDANVLLHARSNAVRRWDRWLGNGVHGDNSERLRVLRS